MRKQEIIEIETALEPAWESVPGSEGLWHDAYPLLAGAAALHDRLSNEETDVDGARKAADVVCYLLELARRGGL